MSIAKMLLDSALSRISNKAKGRVLTTLQKARDTADDISDYVTPKAKSYAETIRSKLNRVKGEKESSLSKARESFWSGSGGDTLVTAQKFYEKPYIKNRYVDPVYNLPTNVKKINTKGQRLEGILGTLNGIATLFPDPIGDIAIPMYDFAKGYGYSKRRGGTFKENLKSGKESMTLEKPIGLGEALFTNKKAGDIGNIAELPLLLGVGGLTSKSSQKAFIQEINDLSQLKQSGRITAKELNKLETMQALVNKTKYKPQKISTKVPYSPKEVIGQQRLSHLMNYPEELRRRGFQPSDIEKINFKQADKIIRNNITPKDWGAEEFENFIRSTTDVKNKANFLDYFKTPEKVLNKLGLESEMSGLRKGWDTYKSELNTELKRISTWAEKVPTEQSSKSIFKYLDGQKVQLTADELKTAKQIKGYLSDWATRLGLPEDKKISHYITHIFEKGDGGVEFSDDISRIIDEKIPRSVYDPFLDKRIGKKGYIEDVWRALEAYVKRATRKVNIDPALEKIDAATADFGAESYKYVQRYISSVNMRPTEVDTLVDNFIKSTPIRYKATQRPTAYLAQKWRNQVFRGTIGLNPKSALRNLTQGKNTYAVLGEKYTLLGYMDLISNWKKNNLSELYKTGVLEDSFITDKNVHALKKLSQTIDDVLFYMFDSAEKINRGSAYFGAKRQALAKGLTEDAAVAYAKNIVRKTQFTFGAIDTPVALRGDVAKVLAQFQTYPLKQAEFLAGLVKDKNWGALTRYIAATLVIHHTVGKALGIKLDEEFIPQFGESPFVSTVRAGAQYAFGNDEQKAEAKKDLVNSAKTLIPAGVTLSRTYEGIKAVNQGASTTPTGRIRFPIEKTPSNYIKAALLGQYSLDGAQEYFDSIGKSKAEVEFKRLKSLKDSEAINAELEKIRREDPDMYSSLKKYIRERQAGITKDDKRIQGLPIKDGSRALAISKNVRKLKTRQEKADYLKHLIQLKIITNDVATQLKEMDL